LVIRRLSRVHPSSMETTTSTYGTGHEKSGPRWTVVWLTTSPWPELRSYVHPVCRQYGHATRGVKKLCPHAAHTGRTR
jgi:hypothetical protein